jgi:tripartite-type tricarboxylate transporter receptor subunit TctC
LPTSLSQAGTALSRRRKTPSEIIDTLAQHVIAAAKDPGNVAQLTALGIETNGPTPEQFGAVIEREQPQFDEVANLQPQ